MRGAEIRKNLACESTSCIGLQYHKVYRYNTENDKNAIWFYDCDSGEKKKCVDVTSETEWLVADDNYKIIISINKNDLQYGELKFEELDEGL